MTRPEDTVRGALRHSAAERAALSVTYVLAATVALDELVAERDRLRGERDAAKRPFSTTLRAWEEADEWKARAEAAEANRDRLADLEHRTRRMLQALHGYWLWYDGWQGPQNRYPRSRSTAEDWWGRFEKYRKRVEELLRA